MTIAVMPGQIVAETPRLCLHAMSDRNNDDAALMLACLLMSLALSAFLLIDPPRSEGGLKDQRHA